MSKVLDGKKLRDILALKLLGRIKKLAIKPKLAIVQVGDLEESNTYIRNKKIFAEKIGAIVLHKKYPKNIKESKVLSDIKKYNSDSTIHGIIVQLPIPKTLNLSNIIESIDPKKDIDGLTAKNIKLLFNNNEAFVPATTKGVITLLEYNKISFRGKKVVIIGQSSLVGKPTALAFLNRKSTVTICDIYTTNLEKETREADILIVAAGRKNLITSRHVSPNQVVVDVGINILRKGKVTGDVDYKNVKNKVRAITPVPGGVGPMTVASLFENLLLRPN